MALIGNLLAKAFNKDTSPTFQSSATPPGDSFSPFKSSTYLSGTKEFLESNSIIAKLAFLLLIIFLFTFLLRLGINVLSWIFAPSENPVLIDGMMNAREMKIISQDPNVPGNKQILRSNDKDQGIEFTWSTWININDLTYKENQYRHIFHKGNDKINTTSPNNGIISPNNAPGLYIAPSNEIKDDKTSSLVVVMNTFNNISEQIIIDNIPIKKWVSVIIRCQGNIFDIFINGTLTRRHVFDSVPKQNYGDVYVAMNGGFDGYISLLKYYNKAIGIGEIQSIIKSGPNLNMKEEDLTASKPQYLAQRWYFSDNVL
jgi:hypothetical protein